MKADDAAGGGAEKIDGLGHDTVLLDEAVSWLLTDDDGIYIDGTFGRGGHSEKILAKLGPAGRLLAVDKDPDAMVAARRMSEQDKRLDVVQADYSCLDALCSERDVIGQVSGLLLDLGVSSPQLDQASRGFSFLRDGALDMRMNPAVGQSAAQWINKAEEIDIAAVMYRYGEERYSRRIARAIVAQRQQSPILTTARLAEIVKVANPAWEKDKHPATRAFQGIRIYINSELDELEKLLNQSLNLLKLGGRLVVISFHSLEDRIVKKFIAAQAKGDNFPRGVPVQYHQLSPKLKSLAKAVKPTKHEIETNPRSRSAIMRVAQRIA